MKKNLIISNTLNASERIAPYIHITPLIVANRLSQDIVASIYRKLENLQPTSSFKVRGAFNKLLSLGSKELSKGVVAASTGNHGAAVAYACQKLNSKAIVFVPKTASETKLSAIKSYGATIHLQGDECGEAEKLARAFANENNLEYISPYNDYDVLTGQGTIGVELLKQLQDINIVVMPVGGGGLIAGVARYLKTVNPSIKIIGSLPENSPVMSECIRLGKIIELDTKPTLSDATAGNMDLDSITFEFCQEFVDDYILVSEDEIRSAIQLFLEKEHMLVEGSVGTTVAAIFKEKQQFKNKKVVAIVTGSNISLPTLQQVICV